MQTNRHLSVMFDSTSWRIYPLIAHNDLIQSPLRSPSCAKIRREVGQSVAMTMNRAVSNYGPLFPTTPAPGAKEDEERTPLLTQLPSAEVLAHVGLVMTVYGCVC